MAKMYYAENPDAKHDLHELQVSLLEKKMTFLTDAGVFSKKRVDYGSQVLLKAVQYDKNDSLLDVGCGYGALGITLQKEFGLEVTMIDINRRAVDLAQKNCLKNGVTADVYQSNLYEKVSGNFDHIISNPPIRAGKAVVHEIIQGAYSHLHSNGSLTIVIQKKQGAPSAKEKMKTIFGNVDTLKKDKGYYVLKSVKTNES